MFVAQLSSASTDSPDEIFSVPRKTLRASYICFLDYHLRFIVLFQVKIDSLIR